jgi:putative transposase
VAGPVRRAEGRRRQRLKELESENARLKRIVADKELQIEALKELGRGNW